MRFSDLDGRRVVVWGAGREGSSVTEHLRARGVTVVVAEPDRPRPESPVVAGVAYAAEGRAELLAADVVVKSPGVPATHPLLAEVRSARVPVTSLTDLWVSEHAHRVVAVTGTKGKSTTASLLHHLLLAAGIRSSLRGNIGTSVLEESDPPAEVVVMELSSYQAQSLTRSPRVVAVTSLFPEHLTWHGSLEAYYRDKLNAVAHAPEVVVVPAEASEVVRRVRERLGPGTQLLLTDESDVHVDAAGDVVWPDGTRVAAADLPLPGRHHAGNIALALRLAGLHGVAPADLVHALRDFAPLPHRMEPVPSGDGRRWIDDSLATAPEAVVASLSALAGERVAVVVGGEDRGLDLTPLTTHLRAHPELTPLLIGPAGARIAQEQPDLAARHFDTFAEAVAWAGSSANPADVVLLSPGAPSYDEFNDYTERSAAFRAAARAAT
ncbi:UDP-N-acetylmuramoyl-L-alanine--D-glutamate ligase [Nocardioides sp. Y6]|uniref:UDP-N-acetylmuramoylalanine--D-glutamate ligase n=1 Tax=Nocardioides malaquae TaxID=2773426 RepID=A0ABR9RQB6_9ACTN|nr:UDP-N-acetylmuramoyl-L-alanine--D-glutamate ligase [Nocardioides malaquae]MBE7323570.1 UDP-N-acetylmuramoyl-L-alanine--D-glutamate ligase [Nocardioides malaquae]